MQFVVCADNVALGIFPSMNDAIDSVVDSGGSIPPQFNGQSFVTGTLRGKPLTIVAVRVPSDSRLLRD